jgi:hypothetical protein
VTAVVLPKFVMKGSFIDLKWMKEPFIAADAGAGW